MSSFNDSFQSLCELSQNIHFIFAFANYSYHESEIKTFKERKVQLIGGNYPVL